MKRSWPASTSPFRIRRRWMHCVAVAAVPALLLSIAACGPGASSDGGQTAHNASAIPPSTLGPQESRDLAACQDFQAGYKDWNEQIATVGDMLTMLRRMDITVGNKAVDQPTVNAPTEVGRFTRLAILAINDDYPAQYLNLFEYISRACSGEKVFP